MGDKIQLKTTLYHKVIFILSVCIIVGTFLYLFIVWSQLPDKVPGHFNGAGEIDRWGSKYELIAIPIISLFMFLGISLMEKYPSVWNTGVTVTEENKERVYREVKNMIVTLKLLIPLTFTFITVYASLAKPLPSWYLPVDLTLIFGSMIYFLLLIYRRSK
jgi:uncharacterized membrane protein